MAAASSPKSFLQRLRAMAMKEETPVPPCYDAFEGAWPKYFIQPKPLKRVVRGTCPRCCVTGVVLCDQYCHLCTAIAAIAKQ